jgi:hypothetical protein
MIDLSHESVVSLTDATKHLPQRRGGRAVHVATLYRWAQRGVRGVRLEILQVGGTKCTSLEALQRFFERLGAAANGETPRTRTSSQRKRATEKADSELAAAGW